MKVGIEIEKRMKERWELPDSTACKNDAMSLFWRWLVAAWSQPSSRPLLHHPCSPTNNLTISQAILTHWPIASHHLHHNTEYCTPLKWYTSCTWHRQTFMVLSTCLAPHIECIPMTKLMSCSNISRSTSGHIVGQEAGPIPALQCSNSNPNS